MYFLGNDFLYRCLHFLVADVEVVLAEHLLNLTLDQIIAALSQAILTKKIPPEAGGDIMKRASGFLSVVIWRNIGGGFISSNIGYGVNINGTNAFVYNRIGRRLQGDASCDVTSFYEELKKL